MFTWVTENVTWIIHFSIMSGIGCSINKECPKFRKLSVTFKHVIKFLCAVYCCGFPFRAKCYRNGTWSVLGITVKYGLTITKWVFISKINFLFSLKWTSFQVQLNLICILGLSSSGSPPKVGVPMYYFTIFFANNCMKMKEFGTRSGPGSPLDPHLMSWNWG